ncbi:MAG: hypothetical protein F6K22_17270 [Okeania sp. SIO2F4]|uniref:hypothetical protein n=1 Tax=Okeania sp. SIO2F4 TaxID=2607790 RepID=UPI00142BA504|nr:hypothetical protein [Okeania sp. SIO2F4]NES04429.1 hypothetical protein [Okeania sp. SIO2F4]
MNTRSDKGRDSLTFPQLERTVSIDTPNNSAADPMLIYFLKTIHSSYQIVLPDSCRLCQTITE